MVSHNQKSIRRGSLEMHVLNTIIFGFDYQEILIGAWSNFCQLSFFLDAKPISVFWLQTVMNPHM